MQQRNSLADERLVLPRDVSAARILRYMRSVADTLRDDLRRENLARTPAERVDQALSLADADCQIAAVYRGIPLAEAKRLLARGRQHRRRSSACHESLLV